jgi:transposase
MTSKTTNKFSPEVRTRAVRMVLDHAGEHPSRWAAVTSIAAKIDCTPQTCMSGSRRPRQRGRRSDRHGREAQALERENRELRQANEILRNRSFFRSATSRRRRQASIWALRVSGFTRPSTSPTIMTRFMSFSARAISGALPRENCMVFRPAGCRSHRRNQGRRISLIQDVLDREAGSQRQFDCCSGPAR